MIETIIISSLFCVGFYEITREGMILGFGERLFKKVEKNKVANFILMPVFGCVTCMGSVIGLTAFLLQNGFDLNDWPLWILNSVSCAFLNQLFFYCMDIVRRW